MNTRYKVEVNDGKSRLLASMGNSKCPLGCIYCFVDSAEYKGLEKIDKDHNFEILKIAATSVDIIQPACDIEIFLVPQVLEKLSELAELGKTISFATKFRLTKKTAIKLSSLNKQLSKQGAILQIAVSFSRLENWKEIELYAPSPAERLKTLKLLYENHIPTTVAIRPLLPFVPENELEELIDYTQQYCYGYISGPVYLTPALKTYMQQRKFEANIEVETVSWMKDNPNVETIRSKRLEQVLETRAKLYNKFVFADNLSAVMFLINRLGDKK
jgi:DNA repair photolyase